MQRSAGSNCGHDPELISRDGPHGVDSHADPHSCGLLQVLDPSRPTVGVAVPEPQLHRL